MFVPLVVLFSRKQNGVDPKIKKNLSESFLMDVMIFLQGLN